MQYNNSHFPWRRQFREHKHPRRWRQFVKDDVTMTDVVLRPKDPPPKRTSLSGSTSDDASSKSSAVEAQANWLSCDVDMPVKAATRTNACRFWSTFAGNLNQFSSLSSGVVCFNPIRLYWSCPLSMIYWWCCRLNLGIKPLFWSGISCSTSSS